MNFTRRGNNVQFSCVPNPPIKGEQSTILSFILQNEGVAGNEIFLGKSAPYYNVNSPAAAAAGEAGSVSSMSPSACHLGGPIGVNPGELTSVDGNL